MRLPLSPLALRLVLTGPFFPQVFEGVDLAALKKVASDKEGKGKELLDSAYSDIRDVLTKHAEKAKKLAGEAKEDATKAATK